jgi:hypothetical protein
MKKKGDDKMKFKSAIVMVIVLIIGLGGALASEKEACIERCRNAGPDERAFAECVGICKRGGGGGGGSGDCAALVKVIIRARITWLEGKDLDLTVDRAIRDGTPLSP